MLKFSVKSKNDLWTISGNFAFGPIQIWMLLVGQKVDYFFRRVMGEKEKLQEEESIFVSV